jgi:hypothetical protein
MKDVELLSGTRRGEYMSLKETVKTKKQRRIGRQNEFKKGYQPKISLVKDESNDLFADFYMFLTDGRITSAFIECTYLLLLPLAPQPLVRPWTPPQSSSIYPSPTPTQLVAGGSSIRSNFWRLLNAFVFTG